MTEIERRKEKKERTKFKIKQKKHLRHIVDWVLVGSVNAYIELRQPVDKPTQIVLFELSQQ